jgi:hypothetical protein
MEDLEAIPVLFFNEQALATAQSRNKIDLVILSAFVSLWRIIYLPQRARRNPKKEMNENHDISIYGIRLQLAQP